MMCDLTVVSQMAHLRVPVERAAENKLMETCGRPGPHWGLVLCAGGPVAPAQVGVGLTAWRCSPPSQVAASGGGHFKETPFKAGLRLKFPKGPVQANEIIKRLLVKWVYIEFACKASG